MSETVASHNPDRVVVWPGYFDARTSRRAGRRVSKQCAVSKPTLDELAWATRQLGITKMKRDPDAQHPRRPALREGRLWISRKDVNKVLGGASKEKLLQLIGEAWRSSHQEAAAEERKAKRIKPKVGDKQAQSQRKSFKQKLGKAGHSPSFKQKGKGQRKNKWKR